MAKTKKPHELPDVEEDNPLWQIKRAGQARCREQVRNGERTQESCFLIPRDVAKTSKVKYRF